MYSNLFCRLKAVLGLVLLLYFTLGGAFAAPTTEGIQSYQADSELSPEHRQKIADDITRYRNADNLWDVLRDEFALSHYENSPAVQEKIEWFMNNQDYLLRSANRSAPYLYYIHQQVKKRHLPAELVLLPIIESGYNPFSLSNVGAAGIWQLMPGTASGLGIKQDFMYDGRRDVIASTRAALNYLAYLQSFFEGNWLLALAAYNTGEGNVLSAIKRNIRDGRDTEFWSLPLAQQTRDYVPSLLALAVIISNPDRYPVYFPPVRNAPYLAQVDVGSQIKLKLAAEWAGISYSKLAQLNPGFSRKATTNRGGDKIVLPIENVEQFTENFNRSPLNQQPLNWLHYRVKPGDTLASISRKFSTTPDQIQQMNHLSKSAVHSGTNLLIPSNGENLLASNEDSDAERPAPAAPAETASSNSDNTFVASNDDDNAESAPVVEAVKKHLTPDVVKIASAVRGTRRYVLQPGDTIYLIHRNDTIAKLAKRFHLTREALISANKSAGRTFKPGKQIIIPTHDKVALRSAVAKSLSKQMEPGDTVYMVRAGDTIEKIAKKFHTSPAVIRISNLVDNDSLNEGEKLVIPTHLRG